MPGGSPATAAKRYTWTTVIATLQNDPRLGMASDWVSAIGGSQTGVYLLYGHPGCDWEFTLSKLLNRARFS
eukprot:2102908-Prorocentrum_lima.AAC.1